MKFSKNFDLGKIFEKIYIGQVFEKKFSENFEKFWWNFRKISILVKILENFEKISILVKFSKYFDFGQIFQKISILVKIFQIISILVLFG